jgi:hypothetical protein
MRESDSREGGRRGEVLVHRGAGVKEEVEGRAIRAGDQPGGVSLIEGRGLVGAKTQQQRGKGETS